MKKFADYIAIVPGATPVLFRVVDFLRGKALRWNIPSAASPPPFSPPGPDKLCLRRGGRWAILGKTAIGGTGNVFFDATIDNMTAGELAEYLAFLEERRAELDEAEPADEDSDAFADWAERHEELEDLYDEALERLELLRG